MHLVAQNLKVKQAEIGDRSIFRKGIFQIRVIAHILSDVPCKMYALYAFIMRVVATWYICFAYDSW